jgi:hypothetical protein
LKRRIESLMVVRLSAGALACRSHVLARLMVGGRSVVIRLCLQVVPIGFGHRRLIEVVWVNFLLPVGLRQENGKKTDCEH